MNAKGSINKETDDTSSKIRLKDKKSKKGQPSGMKKSRIMLHLIAMVCVIALFVVLAIFGLNIYTHHGKEIIVPDVKGLPTNAAVQKLENLGFLTTIDDSVYVKAMRPNMVYEQSIRPGSAAKLGRVIHLTINSGSAPQLIMPDIADNSSLREATARLTSLGFHLGPVEYIKGERDWVYEVKCNGRNIGAGSHVETDDVITLVVGDGTYYDEDVEYQEGLVEDSMSYESEGFSSDFTE